MRRIWIFLTKGRVGNNKLTAALYFVIDKNILTIIIMLSFHYPLALVAAAEGETVPTKVSS